MVNKIIFQLLKEALFQPQLAAPEDAGSADGSSSSAALRGNTPFKFPSDPDFWNRVFNELQAQAVLSVTAPIAKDHLEIPEPLRSRWSRLQKPFAVKYVQMAAGQKETCRLLQDAGIQVAVMKGTAAAIYYPVPEYRSMGDVDLLVTPEDYESAVRILLENGYTLVDDENSKYHTEFAKYNILYELHNSPSGIHRSEKGGAVAEYISSGLPDVYTNTLGQDEFPILPWKQNGMELIWHIRQHLYNGLGLRQIIDWMMFVNYFLDDAHMEEYLPDLEKCGLDQLAIVVTRMCQKYLGLPHSNITWCDGADDALCEELMTFIMEQGNFGHKVTDQKTAKVISGYTSPVIILKKLRDTGKAAWKPAARYPVLSPLAVVIGMICAVRTILSQGGGPMKLAADFRLSRRRKQMFAKLYGKTSHGRSGRSVE